MTSRRYLSNKKKGASYSFFSALKSAAFPGGILTGVYLLIFGVLPFVHYYNYEHDRDYATGQISLRNAKEYYKYIIFSGDDEFTCYAVLALIAGLALALGIILFRFASDKRTVNVYYSLGIRRTSLFYTRWFAGALVICAATAVGVIASYIVNLLFVGLSWQLSLVLFYFYCGLSLFLLLIYTVTAAIFASVGTVSEGIVYSAGIIALPTVICLCAQNLIQAFLKSSPYGAYIYGFSLTGTSYSSLNTAGTLLTQYAAFNPVLFFSKALTTFGVCVKEKDKLFIGMKGEAWHLPSIFSVLPWFFVVVAFALLGGLVFFRLRKAENCGFLNTNKPLSILILFELMLFAACLPLGEAEYYDAYQVIIVSAVLALAAFIAFEIFLERGVKRFFKKSWKFPAFAAAVACVFAVFMTGGFGYDSYVPEVSDVKSVTLSLPVSQSAISLQNDNFGWSSSGYINLASSYGMYSALPEFTDAETIRTVTAAHADSVKKDGVYEIYVKYTHKNDIDTERVFSADDEAMAKLLTVFESPACREQINTMFTNVIDEKATEKEAAETGLAMFDARYATVTAVSEDMYTGNEINLSKEEFNALKAAVLKDLSSRSADTYYNAPYKQYGFLRFSTSLSVWGYNGETYEEEVTSPAVEYVPPVPEEELPEGEADLPAENEKPARFTKADTAYGNFGNCFTGESGGYYDVLIDGSMVNTINYLNSIGAGNAFTSRKTIKSVSFTSAEKYGEYSPENDFVHVNKRREYFADSVASDKYWDYENNKKDFAEKFSQNPITDAEKISQLTDLMRMHVFNYGKGYFCLIAYTDGTFSTRFLPEASAPDYVKNFSYTAVEPNYG